MSKTTAYLLLFLLSTPWVCWGENPSPKYEVRAVWVSTVANLDWPSASNLSPEKQKEEFCQMLDQFAACNINTVIAQVRPSGDAFYPSSFDPWSHYLTGQQGCSPEPYYDPLAFMVEECHKRAMEIHAWVNPYRISNTPDLPLSSEHFVLKSPLLKALYGDKLYFNPGEPQSGEFLLQIIQEIVSKYDVDAIHMDDYFYPYPIRGQQFPDMKQWVKYGKGKFADIADWRRDNVNRLVEAIGKTIKNTKPYVKFGISPFGVWRNLSQDTNGSATSAGTTNYDNLYADVRLWMEKGWVDYVTPQLYWEIGSRGMDYNVLMNWWVDNSFGRQIYVGHALYRLDGKLSSCWNNAGEIIRQIDGTRMNKGVKGSSFFSARHLLSNILGVADSLKNDVYRTPSLIPPLPWVKRVPVKAPNQLAARLTPSGVKLTWKTPSDPNVRYFVIYRFAPSGDIDLGDGSAILAKIPAGYSAGQYTDTGALEADYVYVITSVGRDNVESRDFRLKSISLKKNKDILDNNLYIRTLDEKNDNNGSRNSNQIHGKGFRNGSGPEMVSGMR